MKKYKFELKNDALVIGKYSTPIIVLNALIVGVGIGRASSLSSKVISMMGVVMIITLVYWDLLEKKMNANSNYFLGQTHATMEIMKKIRERESNLEESKE